MCQALERPCFPLPVCSQQRLKKEWACDQQSALPDRRRTILPQHAQLKCTAAMIQPTLTSSPPPALWPAIPRMPPTGPRSLALWRALHAHRTLGTLSIGSILTRWSAWTMQSLRATAEPEQHLPSSYHCRQMGTWSELGRQEQVHVGRQVHFEEQETPGWIQSSCPCPNFFRGKRQAMHLGAHVHGRLVP
jgi:hypothetical protein